MDHGPRTTAKDSQRRHAELAARPVLARLPDVSAEVQLLRTEQRAAGSVGYRFDPPQGSERRDSTVYAERSPRFPTLKSELIYAPQASRGQRPHMFERSRAGMRSSQSTRGESPILPRTNPFAIPQRGILDSLTPFLRFATLVALFTAAGIWIQTTAFREKTQVKPSETPSTTAQEPTNPAAKTAERPGSTSTSATGPVRTTPEANERIGRERESDFAMLRGDILPVTPTINQTTGAMPGLIGANGELPHVQTTEMPAADAPCDATQTPEVARIPHGFSTRQTSPR